MRKIGIGLMGINGHQVHNLLVGHPHAQAVAAVAIPRDRLPPTLAGDPALRVYDSLEALLADPRVELVSLCSPRRRDQSAHALAALQAGKHVYAEKPCAMTEADLDAIVATAERMGKQFHEMAGSAFEQPYREMRRIVQSGLLGPVVQVLVQKSYPYHDNRPADEDIDGGLTLQVGVHALRFVEHITGLKIERIHALETTRANRGQGQLRMATSVMMTLEGGALGAGVFNYCNPRALGTWGNEMVRVFGSEGVIEATDGGTRTRLVLNDRDMGPLSPAEPSLDYFSEFVRTILGLSQMPLSLQDELHPTRMVIRARADAQGR